MYRWFQVLVLLLVLCVGACRVADDPVSDTTEQHPLDGQWQMRVLPLSSECPEVGRLAPMPPGAVNISASSDLVLSQSGGFEAAFPSLGAESWGMTEYLSYQGCDGELLGIWEMTGVGSNTFTATWTVRIDVDGTCDIQVDQCTAQYVLQGAR